jgi:hypothetical protein
MVEALCSKLDGRWFEYQLGHLILPIYPVSPYPEVSTEPLTELSTRECL